MTGTLYMVATPIGNLEDVTFRALRVLKEAAVIAAEDTRVTRKLLSHFDIHTPMVAYHSHSSAGRLEAVIERLRRGEDVALVSDAGTPGISDPGGELVRAAIEAGAAVVPVPGASAVAAAVTASGLDPSRFVFEGFLPRSKGEARAVLRRLAPLPHTLVFYEAPNRAAATLALIEEALPGRAGVVAREITKKFEEFARGTVAELRDRYAAEAPRGECVLLVAGAMETVIESVDLESVIRELLERGLSVRDTAREAAEKTGVSRKETYAEAQRQREASRG
jgi:16S rRNA (cytidine1402-2'-O)-methyltransferase